MELFRDITFKDNIYYWKKLGILNQIGIHHESVVYIFPSSRLISPIIKLIEYLRCEGQEFFFLNTLEQENGKYRTSYTNKSWKYTIDHKENIRSYINNILTDINFIKKFEEISFDPVGILVEYQIKNNISSEYVTNHIKEILSVYDRSGPEYLYPIEIRDFLQHLPRSISIHRIIS